MPVRKKYLDVDVVTAARERIRRIYSVFDSVAVSFSGGKDSLVCLHLAKEMHEELGLGPVKVIFRDEELIPDEVIDFVDTYRRQPWVEMYWFCVPLQSERVTVGRRLEYIQWDEDRGRYVREMPAWGIRRKPGDPKVFSQYDMDVYAARTAGLTGRVAMITGVRAAESIIRYRSVVNKIDENYITRPVGSSTSGSIWMAKPIYDWQEDDVMKWLGESGIGWCPVYDAQNLVGKGQLRVSTPLHAEAAKRQFGKQELRQTHPTLYERIVEIWPDMALMERYHGEFDVGALADRYSADGFRGCRRYIEEHLTGEHRSMALQRLKEFLMLNRKSGNPLAYPPELLMRMLVSGSIKRVPLPLPKAGQEALAAKRKKQEEAEHAGA